MNERIKELAEQSGVYFGKAHKDYFGEEHLAYISTTDIDVAKFAELIVRECAKVVFEKTGPKSALNVLEHFGVEE